MSSLPSHATETSSNRLNQRFWKESRRSSGRAARGGHCVASAVIQMVPPVLPYLQYSVGIRGTRAATVTTGLRAASRGPKCSATAPWDAGTCEPVSMLSERCWAYTKVSTGFRST